MQVAARSQTKPEVGIGWRVSSPTKYGAANVQCVFRTVTDRYSGDTESGSGARPPRQAVALGETAFVMGARGGQPCFRPEETNSKSTSAKRFGACSR